MHNTPKDHIAIKAGMIAATDAVNGGIKVINQFLTKAELQNLVKTIDHVRDKMYNDMRLKASPHQTPRLK